MLHEDNVVDISFADGDTRLLKTSVYNLGNTPTLITVLNHPVLRAGSPVAGLIWKYDRPVVVRIGVDGKMHGKIHFND